MTVARAAQAGGLLVGARSGRAVVVGIGVNVDLRRRRAAGGSGHVDPTRGRRCGPGSPRRRRARAPPPGYLLWQLASGDARRAGTAEAYAERCVTIGREVRALLPGGMVVEGVASSVDDDGRLVLRLPDGATRVVSAGDIEHLHGREAPA